MSSLIRFSKGPRKWLSVLRLIRKKQCRSRNYLPQVTRVLSSQTRTPCCFPGRLLEPKRSEGDASSDTAAPPHPPTQSQGHRVGVKRVDEEVTGPWANALMEGEEGTREGPLGRGGERVQGSLNSTLLL